MLVVRNGQAWYRGSGIVTVNGISGPAEFLIAASDGPNFTSDALRIKLWTTEGIIYDSQRDAADSAAAITPVPSGPASISVR